MERSSSSVWRVEAVGDAEDRADHPERQWRREVRDQVDVHAVLDPVQQAVSGFGDEGFQHRDPARHERRVDQSA
ncbi:hypothetical protein [Streptomyces olivochromogenes]|uniref:hypothetical protein n=1 Tax=Streptomyces olivochromogenes TaxID=1963 RepID=UPI001F48D755|nr:hypothetical protein [Streptomyces olivochromogenes]MCF3131700.1 hypothetical protein [Streptomyces olivochromogenes]